MSFDFIRISYRAALQRTVIISCNLLVHLNDIVVRCQERRRPFLEFYPAALAQAIVVLNFTPDSHMFRADNQGLGLNGPTTKGRQGPIHSMSCAMRETERMD